MFTGCSKYTRRLDEHQAGTSIDDAFLVVTSQSTAAMWITCASETRKTCNRSRWHSNEHWMIRRRRNSYKISDRWFLLMVGYSSLANTSKRFTKKWVVCFVWVSVIRMHVAKQITSSNWMNRLVVAISFFTRPNIYIWAFIFILTCTVNPTDYTHNRDWTIDLDM